MIEIIGTELNQWDTGRSVSVTGIDASHVHFANQGDSKAVIMELANSQALIPDYLFQTGKQLCVYAVANGVTIERKMFSVKKRERPENYIYEDDQRNYIYVLISSAEIATANANEAAENANSAAESAGVATKNATEATVGANTASNNANQAAKNANEAADKAAHTAKSLMVIGEAEGTSIALDDSIDQFLVGLRVFGKTTQDGTPTPDAPVDLVSAGDVGSIGVTVAKKNLWNGKFENIAFGSSVETGPTVTILSYPTYKSIVVPVIPGGKYSFSRGDAVWSGMFIAFTQDYPTIHTKIIFEDGKTTTYLAPYNKGAVLEIPGITVPEDCYYMVVYLTNDSDTYDVTNTWYQVEAGETVTKYEPHNGQTLTISTPNGLPGIPVTSGGNYTDSNGQQWICDEIDFARGVYVQRIEEQVLDGTQLILLQETSTERSRFDVDSIYGTPGGALMSDSLVWGVSQGLNTMQLHGSTGRLILFVNIANNVDDFKTYLSEHPITVFIQIAPNETPLSEEELAAYSALHTYKGHTTVSNDASAYMDLEYVMDAKKYIDSQISGYIHPATVE